MAGLVLAAASGPARAAGDDRLTPVALATTAPGMIRTDTCARPAYPAQEAGTSHSGVVTMRFLIGTDGKVRQSLVVASSGYASLDEAARTAIARCSFHPARADGKAVDAWVHVQYDWQAE